MSEIPKFPRPKPLKLKPVVQAVIGIRQKHSALGGKPGAAVGKVETIAGSNAYFQRYEDGMIILPPGRNPCWVHGEIFKKYAKLGGPTGLLGVALTDEIRTADGVGRYTEFERGAIYWSPKTGANGVWGDIRARWNELGKEKGYLGLPISDEMPWNEPETERLGRISHFQNGVIGWTADDRRTVEYPQRRIFRSNHFGVSSVGGWAELVVTSAGTFHYRGHMHNSGFVGIHCTIASAIKIPGTSKAVAGLHEGNVGGTTSVDSRDEDWNHTWYSDEVRDNWDALQGEIEMKSTIKGTLGGWEVVTLILLPAVGALALVSFMTGSGHQNMNCTYDEGVHVGVDGNNRSFREMRGVRCLPE